MYQLIRRDDQDTVEIEYNIIKDFKNYFYWKILVFYLIYYTNL